MRDPNVVVGYDICSLSRKTTLKIQRNGSMEVTFAFLDLSSFGLLISIDQPLEVVLFELSNIRVILFLSNLDALIPPV